MVKKVKSILPGLIICLIIGVISEVLGKKFSTVGAASFAIFIGIIVGNTIFKGNKYDNGTKFAEKDLLNYSIVLMGANLNLGEILGLGFNGLIFVILQMTLTIIITYWIGRKLKFNRKYCLLMSSGNAVCGSSAIGATAPVIDADDSDKVISITIVNVIGTILMILLPFITAALYNNETLQTSAMMGGILQSVGQVIGSAKFVSDDVVKLATVFKIIRIILLVAIVLVFEKIDLSKESSGNEESEIKVSKEEKKDSSNVAKKRKINIPWFINGFFIICILYTIGVVPQFISSMFKWISSNFEIIALAGIGMRVKINDLIKEGPKAMLYGGAVGVSQIIFAIILIAIFF
ncbi:putative sulfate exporter family transporter [Clostridium sp. DSM 100503]|uniref:putative sulfate exporter family transporter n=1 Tax=unclassified Clostridium TaxID=2614128 RepID=UPI001898476D|nr:putative sulfate exporter family transporter [Clostridium sp. DSM 100503]MCR1949476.1 putative sulfate exporter family transporter [Clostridium sp. DSM 100503]